MKLTALTTASAFMAIMVLGLTLRHEFRIMYWHSLRLQSLQPKPLATATTGLTSLLSQQMDRTPVSASESHDQAPVIETTSLHLTSRAGPLGSTNNPLTIVINLSGEMGNHLSKLAYGFSLKWMLMEEYDITTHIILRHQAASKWVEAAKNVQRCFTATRLWSFEGGNTDEFELRDMQQKQWMGENHQYFNFGPACDNESCIRQNTNFLIQNITLWEGGPTVGDHYNISLPFIFSDGFATIGYFNDRYASRIAELFHFDEASPNCCAIRAEPDESVFHIRNFLVEMPRKGKHRGYEELSPHKVAHEAFGHLKAGDKVAFTSRASREFVSNYTAALEARGHQVRVIEGQNPTQDFCFLLSARKEFFGFTMSSYAVWAAYLGNATQSRLYSIKSPNRIASLGDKGYFVRRDWTDSSMKERVTFEIYNSEEQDEVEANYPIIAKHLL
ncbi:hypothetical protein MHU86_17432 [Fragilaria crotonensis]|nr:hypothetical protein MHU86_17432 [Fragilaria crotonensis]